MNNMELVKKHKLGSGRFVGNHIREWQALYTEELKHDLDSMGVMYVWDTANNVNHSDYGQKILIFTLYFEDKADADLTDQTA